MGRNIASERGLDKGVKRTKSFHLAVYIEGWIKRAKAGDRMAQELFHPTPYLVALNMLIGERMKGREFYTGCSRMKKNGKCGGHLSKKKCAPHKT